LHLKLVVNTPGRIIGKLNSRCKGYIILNDGQVQSQ